jgi:hypothetical protein
MWLIRDVPSRYIHCIIADVAVASASPTPKLANTARPDER